MQPILKDAPLAVTVSMAQSAREIIATLPNGRPETLSTMKIITSTLWGLVLFVSRLMAAQDLASEPRVKTHRVTFPTHLGLIYPVYVFISRKHTAFLSTLFISFRKYLGIKKAHAAT